MRTICKEFQCSDDYDEESEFIIEVIGNVGL